MFEMKVSIPEKAFSVWEKFPFILLQKLRERQNSKKSVMENILFSKNVESIVNF